MSNKNVKSVCIVVDASIARSSGPPASTHPVGSRCRDFLMRLRGVGHRMAWNQAIKLEWDKHRSSFAKQWFVSMLSMNKIRVVSDDPVEELRTAVASCSVEEGVRAVMAKDAHLLEAALASDKRVSSLDNTVRKHFRDLSGTCKLVRSIVWVNPADKSEEALVWLQKGAPEEGLRQLKF